ncbi:unnamed protein product [Citrullus colocynthis]|uniref:Uncharacterized protein n=1 Tax=Citrullus colocynthis TaxID=252529 RepID=A0ABP0Y4J3_9ROSI
MHPFRAPRSVAGLRPPPITVVRSAACHHRRPVLSPPSVAAACSTPSTVAKHPAPFEAVSRVSDRSFLCLGRSRDFLALFGWSIVGGVGKA